MWRHAKQKKKRWLPQMKSITVVFEDSEFEALLKKKKDLTWRKFILQLTFLNINKFRLVNKKPLNYSDAINLSPSDFEKEE